MSSVIISEGLTNDDVGVIGAINYCLSTVARFVGSDEVVPKQSVGDHIESLCNRVDRSVKDKDLAEYLRICALFHDIGEIVGEHQIKKEDEPKIAEYFLYVFTKYVPKRAFDEVNRIRTAILNGHYDSNDSVINLFEEVDTDKYYQHLKAVYIESTSKDTERQKLFNYLDKLDAFVYYTDHRDRTITTKQDYSSYINMYNDLQAWLDSSEYATTEPKMYYDLSKEMKRCLKALK